MASVTQPERMRESATNFQRESAAGDGRLIDLNPSSYLHGARMNTQQILIAGLAALLSTSAMVRDGDQAFESTQAARAIVIGAGESLAAAAASRGLTHLRQREQQHQTTGGGSGEHGQLRGRQGRRHSPQEPEVVANDRPRGAQEEPSR